MRTYVYREELDPLYRIATNEGKWHYGKLSDGVHITQRNSKTFGLGCKWFKTTVYHGDIVELYKLPAIVLYHHGMFWICDAMGKDPVSTYDNYEDVELKVLGNIFDDYEKYKYAIDTWLDVEAKPFWRN